MPDSKQSAPATDATESQRAMRALHESEQLLRLFVEHSPAAIAMLDLQMCYLHVSRRWMTDYRLHGRNIIGLNHYEVFPDLPERWKEIHRRCLAGKVERNEAEPFPRENGMVDWVRWEVRPWRRQNDEVGGLIIFSEVITERVNQERELGRLTRLYATLSQVNQTILRCHSRQDLFESICRVMVDYGKFRLVGIGWKSPETGALATAAVCGQGHVAPLIQTEWVSACGITREAWQTRKIALSQKPLADERTACCREVLQRLGGGSCAALPIRFRGEVTGTLSLCSSEDGFFNDGEVRLLEEIASDISYALDRLHVQEEKLRAEALLQESEAKWRSYIEYAPVGVLVADPSGRHVEANRAAEEMLGYNHGELMDVRIMDLPADPADKAVVKHFAEIASAGYSEGEFQLRRKDGRTVWALVRALQMKSGRFMGVFQDVSRHRELEDQLRQAQKLEGIGQLAGGVAHDFNNILAAILMHVSLLEMTRELPAEAVSSVKEIEAAARRAANVAGQLLMFSRHSMIALRPVSLNEVVSEVLKMLRQLIGEHIDLRFEETAGLPPIKADSNMIEQILINLAVNARDAMPDGGQILIETNKIEINETLAAAKPDRRMGPFVCLSVSDTGCGMDAETMKKIFEPFFTTKENGKGTGLGLATVHGIAAQHKGWVEVESEPRRGSTFRILIPAEAAAPDQTSKIDTPKPSPRGHETILLVEDDPRVRSAISKYLAALGYQIIEAGTGPEALDLWESRGSQIKMLVTDMVMPGGVTGLQLTERLLALKPDLKAIISSGYSSEFVQTGFPAKPRVAYLPKPYRASALAEVIRKSLDETSLPAQAAS